jgi:hypothetical protein
MRNIKDNFPEVDEALLSTWQVKRKSDGALFDEVSKLDDSFTEVTFNEDGVQKTVVFTPGVGEPIENDEYAIVFKYGGDPVIDHNGTVTE